MPKNFLVVVAALLMAAPGFVVAQDDEPASAFIYVTYFVCSPDGESRADEIINTSYKPHYDAAVEHGDILAWSWLQHFVGGTWRRALVIAAADMPTLLDASGALGEIISDKTPEAGRAFSAICSSHEDYIWQTVDDVGGIDVTDARGDAGFSTYMQCDMAKEERADELVREVIGPILDRHMGEGQLLSWNWLRHNVGGKWRRLWTMGAADHKSLMEARARIIEEFGERKIERAMREMNTICHTHEDYMWDVVLQTP